MPAQVPGRGWGTITGTVYDSLLRSPLTRATVWLVSSTRSAQTDDQGRFAFDRVAAGTQTVSFWRSDLDSIGLSTFAAKVRVVADSSVSVVLAVPSHSTFWRSACRGAAGKESGDSGLVFGSVTDAETGHRIPGAQVVISGVAVERAPGEHWIVWYSSRAVTTDPSGSYYVCGTPVENVLAARAREGGFSSGLADVLVDSRGIARRDLAVSREITWGTADAGAGGRGGATLVGAVSDERGRPLPGARASLDGVDGTADADSLGRFVLRDLPSGTQMLAVCRTGHRAFRRPVDLRDRDTTRIDVGLAEAPVLDTSRVTARPDFASIVEGINRRRRAEAGYFLGTAEIRARRDLKSVFETLPLVEVSGPSNDPHIRITQAQGGGYCAPDLYLDGHSADAGWLLRRGTSDLVAVEIYAHSDPSLLQDMQTTTQCGAILVWTRAAR